MLQMRDERGWKWKPKISVKQVANTLSDIVQTGRTIIGNTIADVDYILGNIKGCIQGCERGIDNVRLRLTHRGIQYISLVTGVLCSTGLIPSDIIKRIYEKLSRKLERDPEHKIFHLTNPKLYVWEGAEPLYNEIDPNSFVFNQDKEAWVFIHGMLYSALKKDGSDFKRSETKVDVFDYFYNFERKAKIFNPDPNSRPNQDNSKIEIYLVSYDSEMRDDDEEEIKVLLQSQVLGGGNFYLLTAAVYWREMVRRAKKTANHIIPFLDKLANNKGRAITHSLGCYVLAEAAQKINKNASESSYHRAFGSWWCMSAALPSDAFSNTGDFDKAPLIAGKGADHERIWSGTTVWYSLADIVLMLLYPLGSCTTALGLTGLGVNDKEIAEDENITTITDVHHGPAGDYIERLGPSIQEVLGTKGRDITKN